MGEIARITFLLLLVILLITMLCIALAPFTIEMRISLDHFIIVVIVVGVSLIPTIQSQITNANITDVATASILSLIPFLFGVALLYSTVRGML